jgi:nitrogen fixation/metabolism regulation signal transduction histidine kinase
VSLPRVGQFYLNVHDHRLHCLNDTARQLLREGVPINPSDLERQPLLHLDGSPIDPNELPLGAAWRSGTVCEGAFLWPRIGSLPQVLTWTAAPMVGRDNTVVGISATVVLAGQEPDWEELAGLAHDLRTPLQAVRLLVPVIQSAPRPEVMSEVLTRLKSASDRALSIARDLLHWCESPLQASQASGREWLHLDSFLRDLVAEHDTRARSKGISLETDLGVIQRLEIQSNRIRLGRIIDNLLSNAVRYTSRGRVCLSTMWRMLPPSGGQVLVIAVEDTGQGLTKEEQESIFQPYQRGRAGMADSDSGGSGLGLVTVDRLVGELGLTLEVFSDSGQGSRFEVLVPGSLLRQGN